MSKPSKRETVRYKFTMAKLKALKPDAERYSHYDSEVPKLRITVHPTGGKIMEVVGKPTGRKSPVTVRVCRFGEAPLDGEKGIRARAMTHLADMLDGNNPNELKRKQAIQATSEAFTLRQSIVGYTDDADIKASTAKGYKAAIENHLNDWLDLPLKDITTNMVVTRHAEIAEETPVAANNVMRALRVLFNHFRDEFEDDDGNSPIPLSPTRKLKKKWKRETRRQSFIKPADLPAWWAATEAITSTREGVKGTVPMYHGEGVLAP